MNNTDFKFLEGIEILNNIIFNILKNKSCCNIFLTGGNSAKLFYECWCENKDFKNFSNINFYFSDERSVSNNDINSNYKLVKESLFRNGLPINSNVFKIKIDNKTDDILAKKYSLIIPNSIDILFLGVGLDGHIASIFPNSTLLTENKLLFTSVICEKFPFRRISITPKFINISKNIFLFAYGKDKSFLYENFMNDQIKFTQMPVKLVKNGYWLDDTGVKKIIIK